MTVINRQMNHGLVTEEDSNNLQHQRLPQGTGGVLTQHNTTQGVDTVTRIIITMIIIILMVIRDTQINKVNIVM